MKLILFLLYTAIFGVSFLFGVTFAQNAVDTERSPPPIPLNVKIAKECQPPGATCYVLPAAALQELESRFSTLKELIVEKNKAIKELQEYQSKTCIAYEEKS